MAIRTDCGMDIIAPLASKNGRFTADASWQLKVLGLTASLLNRRILQPQEFMSESRAFTSDRPYEQLLEFLVRHLAHDGVVARNELDAKAQELRMRADAHYRTMGADRRTGPPKPIAVCRGDNRQG